MLDELVIIKRSRHFSERALTIIMLAITCIPALFFGGNSPFAMTLICSLGFLSILNVVIFRIDWHDLEKFAFRKFILMISPVSILFLMSCIRMTQESLQTSSFDGSLYYTILDSSNFSSVFVSSSNMLFNILVLFFGIITALTIYTVTSSRFVLRNAFLMIGSFVAFLGLIGLFIEFFFVISEGGTNFRISENFFITFPNRYSWAGFATIWMSILIGSAIYTGQSFNLFEILNSTRCFILFAVGILFYSILATGFTAQKILAFFILLVSSIIFAIDVFPNKFNISRHISSAKAKILTWQKWIPFVVSIFISIFSFCGILYLMFNSQNLLFEPSKYSPSYAELQLLQRDTIDIIKMKPLFGWGAGSFETVFALHQGSDIANSLWQTPNSDLLRFILEYGIIGFLLVSISPIVLFAIWLIRKDFSKSGMIFFITILGMLALSIFSDIFASSSVFISFWILLITLFTWDKAEIR